MATTARPLTARVGDDDEVHALLLERLPGLRWFPAKGSSGDVEPLAVVDLVDPAGEADVELRLLRLPTGAVLQVPLAHRTAPPADEAGVLGRARGRTVVDGCHDPAFVRAWLTEAQGEHDTRSQASAATRGMRVLGGEQSNTSVLLPEASPPAILKVFRVLSDGPSPDVEVPLALSRAGWAGVPRPLAWLAGAWPTGGEVTVGHLGVLSELVLGAEDGFVVACRHAARDEDFGDLAELLGRTTAQMHLALRSALPTAHDDGSDRSTAPERVTSVLRERARTAVAAVPELGARAEGVAAVLGAVDDLPALPPLQRVHGDYHLGQVLHSARGWSVLDFEGEPQASSAERNRPDLALRDLAGMLRSVDYAAAVGRAPSPAWARAARDRLVDGYLAEQGSAAHGTAGHGTAGHETAGHGTDRDDATMATLLRALELDKALYEAVYESRNRPDWLPIPLAGVDRLLGRAD